MRFAVQFLSLLREAKVLIEASDFGDSTKAFEPVFRDWFGTYERIAGPGKTVSDWTNVTSLVLLSAALLPKGTIADKETAGRRDRWQQNLDRVLGKMESDDDAPPPLKETTIEKGG